MVKYCDGFSCKKKKKRGRHWVYLNGVSNTKPKAVRHPNDVVITNVASKPSMSDRNWEGLKSFFNWLPPVRAARTLFEGFRDRDLAKIGWELGNQALTTASVIPAGMLLGRVGKLAQTAYRNSGPISAAIKDNFFRINVLKKMPSRGAPNLPPGNGPWWPRKMPAGYQPPNLGIGLPSYKLPSNRSFLQNHGNYLGNPSYYNANWKFTHNNIPNKFKKMAPSEPWAKGLIGGDKKAPKPHVFPYTSPNSKVTRVNITKYGPKNKNPMPGHKYTCFLFQFPCQRDVAVLVVLTSQRKLRLRM